MGIQKPTGWERAIAQHLRGRERLPPSNDFVTKPCWPSTGRRGNDAAGTAMEQTPPKSAAELFVNWPPFQGFIAATRGPLA